jgi:hypothetical protein
VGVRYRDPWANLPKQYFGRSQQVSEEWLIVWSTIEVLAKHAVEKRDAKMAGRCLAALSLLGYTISYTLQDSLYLFDEYYDEDVKADELKAVAWHFFHSGTRRRSRLVLRAEAVGLVWTLRWLYRAGLLEQRTVQEASNQPYLRSRECQRHRTMCEPIVVMKQDGAD